MTEEVIVALIAAAAVVLAATVPTFITARHARRRAAVAVAVAVDTAQETQDRIGTPNGQGNVVQMLERVLATQAELLGTTAELLGGQAAQDRRIAGVERGQLRTVAAARRVEGRLGTLEAHLITTKPPPQE